ncbi:hypothetical protein [Salinactinospora qingdaonensis]|uniref:Uncharacterized protein n=1 Tax=Salinactinospora qingdaonensis TaxID=702744 RepID=A0ABP7G387_9ACTN
MSTPSAEEKVDNPESDAVESPEASFEVPAEVLMGGAEPVPTVQIS